MKPISRNDGKALHIFVLIMKIELYDYQKDAVGRLRSGSILCADVGIGKSITALAYFLERECGGSLYIERNLHDKHFKKIDLYIITTAKKRDDHDWENEASRFSIYPNGSGLGIKLKVDSWKEHSSYLMSNVSSEVVNGSKHFLRSRSSIDGYY